MAGFAKEPDHCRSDGAVLSSFSVQAALQHAEDDIEFPCKEALDFGLLASIEPGTIQLRWMVPVAVRFRDDFVDRWIERFVDTANELTEIGQSRLSGDSGAA